MNLIKMMAKAGAIEARIACTVAFALRHRVVTFGLLVSTTLLPAPLRASEFEELVKQNGGFCLKIPQAGEVGAVLIKSKSNPEAILRLCKENKSIVFLTCQDVRISKTELELLGAMTWLQRLSLNRCGVTDQDLKIVGKLLDLEMLSLTGNEISDEGMAELKELSKLRKVVLQKVPIDGTGLKCFANAEGLTELYLDGSPISDSGLAEICRLGSLKTVNLSQTKVSNAGLARLVEMPNLLGLRLTGSKVTLEGADAFQKQREEFLREGIAKSAGAAPVHIDLVAPASPKAR